MLGQKVLASVGYGFSPLSDREIARLYKGSSRLFTKISDLDKVHIPAVQSIMNISFKIYS